MPRIVTYVLELLFRSIQRYVKSWETQGDTGGEKRERGGVIRENARDMAILSINVKPV